MKSTLGMKGNALQTTLLYLHTFIYGVVYDNNLNKLDIDIITFL